MSGGVASLQHGPQLGQLVRIVHLGLSAQRIVHGAQAPLVVVGVFIRVPRQLPRQWLRLELRRVLQQLLHLRPKPARPGLETARATSKDYFESKSEVHDPVGGFTHIIPTPISHNAGILPSAECDQVDCRHIINVKAAQGTCRGSCWLWATQNYLYARTCRMLIRPDAHRVAQSMMTAK